MGEKIQWYCQCYGFCRLSGHNAVGNVYVTGQTAEAGTRNDYTTIKYNSEGELKWLKKYSGTGGVDDGADP